jgi:hypothetical protein
MIMASRTFGAAPGLWESHNPHYRGGNNELSGSEGMSCP